MRMFLSSVDYFEAYLTNNGDPDQTAPASIHVLMINNKQSLSNAVILLAFKCIVLIKVSWCNMIQLLSKKITQCVQLLPVSKQDQS